MPQQDDSFEVQFPLNGVDTASEYGVPRPGTTIRAFNCRSLDPLQERSRGGSRHGLVRYPDDQIPATKSVTESFTAPGDSTWTAPVDLIGTVKVEMWGAGGGGLDGNTLTGGVGPGGGEYSQLSTFGASPGNSYPFTIGLGGGASDGGDSTFNTSDLIAIGGKVGDSFTGLGGAGGSGGTGDVTFDGGAGGNSGFGLGGAGGGASGDSGGAGLSGVDGQASNTGGAGGVGASGGGSGGSGATGDVGSEASATAGTQPGGGGAGGAFNSGGISIGLLLGANGADGKLVLTYDVPALVQHLNQLVVLDPNYLLTSFENFNPDFVPDPSTNNFPDGNPAGTVPSGNGTRNPDRDIPPGGDGGQPNRYMPPSDRRRLIIVPSSPTAIDGATVTMTITLQGLPGTIPTAGLVTVTTRPSGHSGDGASATTSGGGTATLDVSEPTYEGQIIYTATHLYIDAVTGKPAGTRSSTKVTWRPNYNLGVVSTDGTQLDADGKSHPLVSVLSLASDGTPVRNRRILLRTDPSGRFGDLKQRLTNPLGEAIFTIKDSNNEDVTYTVALIPRDSGPPTISASTTVTWGVGDLQIANGAVIKNDGFHPTLADIYIFLSDAKTGTVGVAGRTINFGTPLAANPGSNNTIYDSSLGSVVTGVTHPDIGDGKGIWNATFQFIRPGGGVFPGFSEWYPYSLVLNTGETYPPATPNDIQTFTEIFWDDL